MPGYEEAPDAQENGVENAERELENMRKKNRALRQENQKLKSETERLQREVRERDADLSALLALACKKDMLLLEREAGAGRIG